MTLDRLGFYYFPDTRHDRQADLDRWLPTLRALGARWLVVRAPADRAVSEAFLKGLKAAGIEPILHLAAPVGALRTDDLRLLLPVYARWGVRHVAFYDRPNLQRAWPEGAWARPRLVERFADAFLPALEAAWESGLTPLFPPLEPNGDYPEAAFAEAALRALARRTSPARLRALPLAAYLWLSGGEAEGEEPSQPRPFEPLESLRQAAEKATGGRPEVFILGTGPKPASEEAQVRTCLRLLAALRDGPAPHYLRCLCFYLLACEPGDASAGEAWFVGEQPREVVHAFRRGLVPPKTPTPMEDPPRLAHYVLAPADLPERLPEVWHALTLHAARSGATLGFSEAEARLARQVTLAGHPIDVVGPLADRLRQAGCQVHLLDPSALSGAGPAALFEATPAPATTGVSHG